MQDDVSRLTSRIPAWPLLFAVTRRRGVSSPRRYPFSRSPLVSIFCTRPDNKHHLCSTAGALIASGQSFDSRYSSDAHYTDWLSTISPTSMAQSYTFMTGQYFERFSEPNYPGVANFFPVRILKCLSTYQSKSKPTAQLVMAVSLGGFSAGKNATNVTNIIVLGEWADIPICLVFCFTRLSRWLC